MIKCFQFLVLKNLFLRAKTIFLFLKFINAFGKLRKKIALGNKEKEKEKLF